MHVLIYEGRNATSSNTLINVFTFIFISLKSAIIKICQRNHFGKKNLQHLAKNDNGLSLFAIIPHFLALFLSFLGILVFQLYGLLIHTIPPHPLAVSYS